MRYSKRWMLVLLVMAGVLLPACGSTPPVQESGVKPATVEAIAGSDLSRVILTADAAKRIDIQTAPVRNEQVNGAQREVISYDAVLYDAQGDTWTYTSPAPLTFVRHHITVDSIDGDRAVLSEGPPIGMAVVTVGAAQLYGAEFEFEE
jgi:hypothetical protein